MPDDLLDQLVRDPDFLTLSEADQDRLYEELSGAQPRPRTSQERVEERIAGRSSNIPTAANLATENISDFLHPASRLANTLINPIGELNRRIGVPALTKQATMASAATEVPYSAAANTALALQRGQPREIIPDVVAGLQGRRPATLGDVYAGAGVPEPFADIAGVGTDIALTPGGARGVIDLTKGGIEWARTGTQALARGGRNIGQTIQAVKTALRRPPLARTTEEVARVPASEAEFLQPQQRAEYFKQQQAALKASSAQRLQQVEASKLVKATQLKRRQASLENLMKEHSDEAVIRLREQAPEVFQAKSNRFTELVNEDLAKPEVQQAVLRNNRLIEDIEKEFVDTPELLDEVLPQLKLEPDGVIGIPDLWQRVQQLRRTIRRPALSGRSKWTFGDVAANKVSNALITTLEHEGMPHLAQARAEWKPWAIVQNVIYKRIGLEGERTAGAQFFRGVVTDPSRKAMVKDIEKELGTNLTDDLFRTYGRLKGNTQERQALGETVKQQVARIKAVEKAQLSGQASRAYAITERAVAHEKIRAALRKVGTGALYATGVAGASAAGMGLLRLFGQRQSKN